jgi:hypothetical protein
VRVELLIGRSDGDPGECGRRSFFRPAGADSNFKSCLPTPCTVGLILLPHRGCKWEPTANRYFIAMTRLPRRDLYRLAVFSCSVPFWMALSSTETVVR